MIDKVRTSLDNTEIIEIFFLNWILDSKILINQPMMIVQPSNENMSSHSIYEQLIIFLFPLNWRYQCIKLRQMFNSTINSYTIYSNKYTNRLYIKKTRDIEWNKTHPK